MGTPKREMIERAEKERSRMAVSTADPNQVRRKDKMQPLPPIEAKSRTGGKAGAKGGSKAAKGKHGA